MTNTKSSSRLPPKVASGKDLLKPITRGSAMKPSAAGTKASSIDSSKLATAAARQIDSLLGNHDSVIKPVLTNKFSILSDTNYTDQDTQASDIPNGQASPSFLSSSLPLVSQDILSETSFSSLPDFALSMQKQLRDQNKKFEAYEARFTAMEAIIQENIALKANTSALESTIREQAARIAQLEKNLNAPVRPTERMEIDLTRDTSTNASIWAKAPPTNTTTKASSSVSAKKSTQGLTAAQVVALNAAKPLKKKMPVKKPTSETISQAARPFLSVDPNTPQGFKYIYLGRSRKITRAETRKRFKTVGINTSRILDITFPATGVIGVLVHVLYAPVFIDIMSKVGAGMLNDFDPLDPKHLADPRYNSLSVLERAQVAFDINANRCIHALLFLHNTKPHQVRPVGHSLVELGYISDEELDAINTVPKQDPKLKINIAASKLFNYHPSQVIKNNEDEIMQETSTTTMNKDLTPKLFTSDSAESL